MSCAKMAEPIEIPFGLWTWVGRRKHKFNRIRQVAPMCHHGRAHWREPVNTTVLLISEGNAALCQITLTTCYYYSISCCRVQMPLSVATHWYRTLILLSWTRGTKSIPAAGHSTPLSAVSCVQEISGCWKILQWLK